MTFFFLLFTYLALTEVYDDTELMIFKPRFHALIMTIRRRQNYQDPHDRRSNPESSQVIRRSSANKEQSCIYDTILCGGLRNCMLRKFDPTQNQFKKWRSRCIGLTILSTLAIIAWLVMELSHLQAWSEWFEEYAPHYSDRQSVIGRESVQELNKLNLAKTLVSAYLLIFGLLSRLSMYIVLPIVSIIGSPVFLLIYCKFEK